jgi:hypothetical protein
MEAAKQVDHEMQALNFDEIEGKLTAFGNNVALRMALIKREKAQTSRKSSGSLQSCARNKPS